MESQELPETRQELGRRIEDAALELLLSSGNYKLLRRNYRCKTGEIDLICEEVRGDAALELVFIEVRARTAGGWVDGVESVGPVKQSRLRRAAQRFLMTYRGHALEVRFDVLAWDGRVWTHLRDAWCGDDCSF
ncbi:MAG: hypothetical protein A2583_01125 [Bdellovibrionales bacterium RIFOXYD1_FULL_53_11]|nr:MAG: hypothetical protein A2583_01125 [Bdellovibrionales bacterium RIFOXYD1_FULL_53_11]